ncbi:hypothetical protein ONS95_000173 [Cadophora gregata]|uniref:uncharacterized protein n=1 Tax=Cadophora gregata TaxID=51156 RepID=UPI0026DB7AF9|nr:uncharacterized protein ONS95_000173 [Cadophora gregata]KAK0115550.1 hypothetical protein ONS96_014004 [Cadophora gregata f. sp. sojae]KAK0128194.1 hypothetical protein ONS95_000173 [Cadophora gregata]
MHDIYSTDDPSPYPRPMIRHANFTINMEPFPKRQRFYAPMDRSFPQSFDDQHAYYDELGEDILEDEEDYDEEEEQEPGYDPEEELEQKRARLDYKLKSTFESIFEKYERDFDGVGDEIDLETGEIVVNNGHLVQMLDEQDAGDTSGAMQVLREYTQEPDELPSSSFDATEIVDDEEEEEEEDEIMSDEDLLEDDMAEDDMILRGFAIANRFQQGSPELGLPNSTVAPERARRQEPLSRPAPLPRPIQAKSLPSRAEILAQFGPQLGPQIVEYVSQQHVAEERHVESSWRAPEPRRPASRNIESVWRTPALPSAAPRRVEPAWRVPELPSAAPIRRPIQKPVVILPEEERSLSPDASKSIWAPIRNRGPRRLDGADNSALFKGQSRASNYGSKSILYPFGYRSTHNTTEYNDFSSPKRRRVAFTAEEDDILLRWVSKLRRHGLALSQGRWREFAAEHPQHSASSWSQRYTRKFTYLSSNQVEESDLSNSEASVENLAYHAPAIKRAEPQYVVEQATRERPARIRKPAQTDPAILSWNQAVDSIESVDPILHAGIMEDARRANNVPHYSSFRRQEHQILEDSDLDTPNESQENTPPTEIRRSYDDLPIRSSLAVQGTPEEDDCLIPGAPCPHADCRLRSSTLYRLQRREHEQLSEMCLHLFKDHHTTPFPCGEIDCPKKGVEGFFMQLDLVKHVRRTHKSVSALQRLRGRVDSALLEQQVTIARPATSDPSERPTSQHRDSDFMSLRTGHARNLSSSQPSGFDPDRTLTPRGMAGASAFTPMTSVSSLKVNHPSATSTSMAVRGLSNSHDRTISDSQFDSSQIASSQPRMAREPQRQSGESSRMPLSGEPSSGGFAGVQIPPTPQTSTEVSPVLGQTDSAEEQILEPHDTAHATIESGPQASKQHASGHPVPKSLHEVPFSVVPQLASTNPKQPTRNIIDPTYEFSDDEPEVRPTTMPGQQISTPKQISKQRAKAPLVAVSVSIPITSMPMPRAAVEAPVNSRLGALKADARPADPNGSKLRSSRIAPEVGPSANRPKSATKSVATPAAKTQKRVRSEDIDELSLGVDEFILLSSRPRSKPLPVPQIGIKHEEMVDSPVLLSVPAARKRKLDAMRDNELDELSVLGERSAPNAMIPQPAIKTETYEPSLPVHRPIMPKRKGRPAKAKNVAESSSSQLRSSRGPETMHHATSTPLLDLTPARNARANAERMKEIGDSEEEGETESPSHRPKQRPRGQTARPVDFGTMTPTKSRWNRDSLKAEQVSVLVKTPGGTMRRCGIDGFECGRSFCFRCDAKESEKVV